MTRIFRATARSGFRAGIALLILGLSAWSAAIQAQPSSRQINAQLLTGQSQAAQIQRSAEEVRELSRACTFGDCENGYGVMEIKTSIGQDVYRGNFENGLFHGNGKLTTMISRTHRAYYDGNWDQGIRSGRGTYWNGVSDLYIGEWKDNKRHGKGSYFHGLKDWQENLYTEDWLSRNTENYTGDFMTDFYHGHGTYRWPGGERYEGEFFANKKHGPGTFYYARGSRRPQMWEYGKLLK